MTTQHIYEMVRDVMRGHARHLTDTMASTISGHLLCPEPANAVIIDLYELPAEVAGLQRSITGIAGVEVYHP